MLRQPDPSKGTVIRVRKRDGDDVTGIYATWLGERNRAVRHIITALDYGYLYNGFLQHSNPQLSKRLFDDYVSGELNWLLWKHVMPLGVIFSLLEPYYRLMRVLTFPSLGALYRTRSAGEIGVDSSVARKRALLTFAGPGGMNPP